MFRFACVLQGTGTSPSIMVFSAGNRYRNIHTLLFHPTPKAARAACDSRDWRTRILKLEEVETQGTQHDHDHDHDHYAPSTPHCRC